MRNTNNNNTKIVLHIGDLIYGMNKIDIENYRKYNEQPFPKPCFDYKQKTPVIMKFLEKLTGRINETGLIEIKSTQPMQSEDDPFGSHFTIEIKRVNNYEKENSKDD